MDSFSKDFNMYISSNDNVDSNLSSNRLRVTVPTYVTLQPAGKRKWYVALTELTLPTISEPLNYNGQIALDCSIADLSIIGGVSRPILRRFRLKRNTIFDNIQYIRATQSFPSHIDFVFSGDNYNTDISFAPGEIIYFTLNFKLK